MGWCEEGEVVGWGDFEWDRVFEFVGWLVVGGRWVVGLVVLVCVLDILLVLIGLVIEVYRGRGWEVVEFGWWVGRGLGRGERESW